MRIYKYTLPIADVVTLEMPKGARILSLQTQHGAPCIWALVDPGAEQVMRTFYLFGTGHTVKALTVLCAFVGTFQMYDGELVFHVFDAGEVLL